MKSSWWVVPGLVLLVAVPVAANEYFPLRPDLEWHYATADGSATLDLQVTGIVDILGTPTFEVDGVETGPLAQHYRYYYSVDPQDGSVYLHAVWGEGSTGILYDPPVEVFPPDELTDTYYDWQGTTVTYNGWPPQHDTPADTLDYYFGVGEPDTVTVPAGTFPVLVITHYWEQHAGGKVRERGQRSFRPQWFSAGVGMVQEGDLELLSASTPNRPATWTEVKSLFR